MERYSLRDGPDSFDVSRVDAPRPGRVVLFAVGAGGNPERHAPLLAELAACGCTVVAPHFERLVSPQPTDEQLLLRARRLALALDATEHAGAPVVGVGHSIGATVLLAMAGGALWPRPPTPLPIAKDARLSRLVLLAPPTGYFRAPHALDGVAATLQVWAGSHDVITPPAQSAFLKDVLGARVDLRVADGAGHFSFMHVLPPQVVDPHPDRAGFLARLTAEVRRFVQG
ncbi:MAG: alpha/beta hydrolase [Myxococcota bacterium]